MADPHDALGDRHVDADPAGEPTEAKDEAMGREVHVVSPEGGAWVWDTWLGPALTAGR